MDIPPPPPPPPSPDDAPPPPAPHDAPTSSYASPPPPPQAPYDPQGPPPYGDPGQQAYGSQSFGQDGPPPPGQQPPPGQPPYGRPPYGRQPPYGQPPQGRQQPPYGGLPPYPGQNAYGQQSYPGYPGANPGPYGYPQQPAGWYAPEANTNGMAIASLVTSFTCIPFLGAIFGLVALNQIKKRRERGKGLAIAGLVLSSVGSVLLVVFIVLGVTGAFDDGDTRVDRISVGQCFDTVDSSLHDYGGDGARSTTVDVVDCSEAHDAEAYAIFTVDPSDDGGYPGVDQISAIAETKCAGYADGYANGSGWKDTLDVYYYMPPADGWIRGDHKVTCFFGGTDGRVTGSVKDGGNGSGFGV